MVQFIVLNSKIQSLYFIERKITTVKNKQGNLWVVSALKEINKMIWKYTLIIANIYQILIMCLNTTVFTCNPVIQVLLSLFYRWGKWSSCSLNDLSKVIQIRSYRMRIWSEADSYVMMGYDIWINCPAENNQNTSKNLILKSLKR